MPWNWPSVARIYYILLPCCHKRKQISTLVCSSLSPAPLPRCPSCTACPNYYIPFSGSKSVCNWQQLYRPSSATNGRGTLFGFYRLSDWRTDAVTNFGILISMGVGYVEQSKYTAHSSLLMKLPRIVTTFLSPLQPRFLLPLLPSPSCNLQAASFSFGSIDVCSLAQCVAC